MKKNNYIYVALLTFGATFTGCDSIDYSYNGNAYVHFSDSVAVMPVTTDPARSFTLYIGSSKSVNYDRTYIVDIDHNKTNAIEGYHFELESKNITIKANQSVGEVTLFGKYDNINPKDSLAITLKVLTSKEETNSFYKPSANIRLIKSYPYKIDDYVGVLRMRATFPFSESATTFLVKSKKIDNHTIMIESPFDEKFNMTLKLTEDLENPLNNKITVVQQPIFIDASYGVVYANSVEENPSFYSPTDRGLALYLNLFLPKIGSFGSYWYTFQWVDPYDAEEEQNGINSSFGSLVI